MGVLELLADREQAGGAITAAVQQEFGITQPAVSQHLRVLRDNGFATIRPEGIGRGAVEASLAQFAPDASDPPDQNGQT